MIRLFVFISLILVCLCGTLHAVEPPWATGQSQDADIDVELLTFDQGDEIPSWFGHTALLVRDRKLGVERVYNYGMFSFGSDMLPKFLMGRLEFWVAQAGYRGTLSVYRRENRGIRTQVLNLAPDQAMKMAKFLAWNVLPENRYYMYDHYFDNCATRIRDAIDQAVGGQFKEAMNVPGRMTLREHTRRHAQRNPYIDIILTFWMNAKIDQPIARWDEMFLPSELEQNLATATYVDHTGQRIPIVRETKILFEAPREPVPSNPSFLHPYLILFSVILGGIGFACGRWMALGRPIGRVLFGGYTFGVGLLIGLPGAILGLFFPLTEHGVTHWNVNLFFANPWTFLAVPLGIAIMFGSKRAHRWMYRIWQLVLLLSGLGMIVGLFVDQSVTLTASLLVPLNVMLVWATFRSFRADELDKTPIAG